MYHAAFVLPAVFACYTTDGNLKKLKKDNAYLHRLIDANIEGDRAIRNAGHAILQDADAIYREEVAKAGVAQGLGQYFAALTNMRSVGVMGDERTYDYAVALRAVTTADFMTAEAAHLPWEVIDTVTSRIVNEVPHINRVLYDCTGKPPATVEFE